MGTMVPIELFRLRSATTTYLEILRDSRPLVEVLTRRDDLRMAPLAELHEAIRSAVDMPNLSGTPADIRTARRGRCASAAPSFRTAVQVRLMSVLGGGGVMRRLIGEVQIVDFGRSR